MYQIENPNGQNCLRQKQKLECEGMSHFFCVITCPTKNILKCTTSCMVHLETQLVELRSCNWVVAIFPFPRRSSAQSGLVSKAFPWYHCLIAIVPGNRTIYSYATCSGIVMIMDLGQVIAAGMMSWAGSETVTGWAAWFESGMVMVKASNRALLISLKSKKAS